MIAAYLRAFVNWEQNKLAKLLPIAEFAFNNAKNTSTGYIPFEPNYGLHPQVLFEKDVNLYSRFCLANKLADKLKKLIEICY